MLFSLRDHPGDCEEACVDDQERMFIVAPLETNEEYDLFQLPFDLEERISSTPIG